jgi:hypothetical protein
MLEFMASFVVLLLLGPLVLMGLVASLVVFAALLPNSGRRVRETFFCPWTRKVVTADFLVPESAAHPSEVASCTAFLDPERVACKKFCREAADVQWGLSRGVFPRWALTAGGVVTWRGPGEPASGKRGTAEALVA